MKLKLRLLKKLTLIILLFGYGLIITAAIYPLLNLFCSVNYSKVKRNKLKTHWLKIFSTIMNLSITKVGELPVETVLLVSNHISWLDIIVLGQLLPAYFVAKSDILSWPVIGYLSMQAGTIFIRRGDKKQIKLTAEKMVWVLKQNSHIIAFPEGTTTLGEEVLDFHSSLFQPAILNRSAVQPVALKYEGIAMQQAPFIGDDEFIPHLIKMLSLDKIEVRVCFLPLISCFGRDRHSVSFEAREMISEGLEKCLFTENDSNQCELSRKAIKCQ